jgi:hypothetical protein
MKSKYAEYSERNSGAPGHPVMNAKEPVEDRDDVGGQLKFVADIVFAGPGPTNGWQEDVSMPLKEVSGDRRHIGFAPTRGVHEGLIDPE